MLPSSPLLGLAALTFGALLPDWVDPIMGRIVGVTLLVLGLWVLFSLYQYARHGTEFRLRSRWMLVFDGGRYAWRRLQARMHGHEHVDPIEMSSYGPKTAFGVGMIHGIGAETGSQVLIIAAVGGAAGQGLGVPMMLAFILGLLASNSIVVLVTATGFVASQLRTRLYIAIGVRRRRVQRVRRPAVPGRRGRSAARISERLFGGALTAMATLRWCSRPDPGPRHALDAPAPGAHRGARQADGHVTGAELVERCRELDPATIPSTVYRTLDVLEELGLREPQPPRRRPGGVSRPARHRSTVIFIASAAARRGRSQSRRRERSSAAWRAIPRVRGGRDAPVDCRALRCMRPSAGGLSGRGGEGSQAAGAARATPRRSTSPCPSSAALASSGSSPSCPFGHPPSVSWI